MLSRWECQHYGTSPTAIDGITNLGRQLSLVDLCDIVVRTLTVPAQFRMMTGSVFDNKVNVWLDAPEVA